MGLPGTVREVILRNAADRGGISCTFPEAQDRILAAEAKSLRLMSARQHFTRTVQHIHAGSDIMTAKVKEVVTYFDMRSRATKKLVF